MKKLLSSTLLAFALAGAAHAQLTLHDFSSFEAPETLFYGDWSDTGDPFTGSLTPTASFSQGAGFFNFASVSNADTSFAEHTFGSALNLGSSSLLSLTLRLLDDNTADSLTVFLFDGGARSAFATFETSSFTTAGFSTRTLEFTAEAGFDLSGVSAFRIGGNDPFAGALLSVAIDHLAADSRSAAVPEPSTYGVIAAAALGLLLAVQNRRRTV